MSNCAHNAGSTGNVMCAQAKPAMRLDLVKQHFSKRFGTLIADPSRSQSEQKALLDAVTYRFLDEGSVLMKPGDTCHQFLLVINGCIRVFKTSQGGREITLYRIEAGQSCILSASCLRDFFAFPATAVAESSTAAAFIPLILVKKLLNNSPVFRDFVLDQYTQRLASMMELVEEVAFKQVDQRLREFLLTQICTENGSIRLTHQEIASNLGTSREVVSRILKDWEQRKLLKLGRAEISLSTCF